MLEFLNKILQTEDPFLLLALFIFGSFSVMLVSALLCFPAKYIHTRLYDFFGFITSSALLSMFANLLITMPVTFLLRTYSATLLTGGTVSLFCFLIVLYKFTSLNKLGLLIEKTNFENRSDEFYVEFYENHYKKFFAEFFKEPPPEIAERLLEGFKQAYKSGSSIRFSEQFVADFLTDFTHDFPADMPVENIESFLHEFFEKNYSRFLAKFPNEFADNSIA